MGNRPAYKVYFATAKILVDQAIRLVAARLGWSWLGGPAGFILSWIFSPFLATMISEGFLIIEFAKFDFLVGKEKEEYVKSVEELKKIKLNSNKKERDRAVKAVKKATREFISLRKHLS